MNFYNLFFSELEISASRSGFARDEKEKNKSTREIIRRMSAGKEKEKKNPIQLSSFLYIFWDFDSGTTDAVLRDFQVCSEGRVIGNQPAF